MSRAEWQRMDEHQYRMTVQQAWNSKRNYTRTHLGYDCAHPDPPDRLYPADEDNVRGKYLLRPHKRHRPSTQRFPELTPAQPQDELCWEHFPTGDQPCAPGTAVPWSAPLPQTKEESPEHLGPVSSATTGLPQQKIDDAPRESSLSRSERSVDLFPDYDRNDV